MKAFSISLMVLSLFLVLGGEGQAKHLIACIKNTDRCIDICRGEDLQTPSIVQGDSNCNRDPLREGTHGCYCE